MARSPPDGPVRSAPVRPYGHARARQQGRRRMAHVMATSRYPSTYNQPLPDERLVACLDCDLLQRLPDLEPGASARCPRCDKELWRRREDPLDRTLALAVAAAML